MRLPDVDYRKFRLSKLNTPEFSHMKLLFFWPIYGLIFRILERVWVNHPYHVVYCALDSQIPFCEYFVIPYLFWFAFITGMLIYSFFWDVDTFKRYMKFIIVSISITLLIYIIFPTSQELRPTFFVRDNIFTRYMKSFYEFDTNTNVCPSIHVICSLAVWFAARKSKDFSSLKSRLIFFGIAIIISCSTVFLKQHSLIDVVAGVVLSLAIYPFVFAQQGAVVNIFSRSKKNKSDSTEGGVL